MLDDVQLENVYPVLAVATMAWILLLVPVPRATTVPAAAKLVPLNVIVEFVNAPVTV